MSIYGAKRIADNIDVLLDDLKVEMTEYTSNQIEAARNTIHDWTITFINTEKDIMDNKVLTLENSLRDAVVAGDRLSRDQARAMTTTLREEATTLATTLREEDSTTAAAIRHEFSEGIADHKTLVDTAIVQLIEGVSSTTADLRTDMLAIHGDIRAEAVTGDEGVVTKLSDDLTLSFRLLQDEYTDQNNTLRTDLVTSVDFLSNEITRADDEVKKEVYANADVNYENIRNEMAPVGVGVAFLPTAGGAMTGHIDMATHSIKNLPDAVDLGDPVNFKEYSLYRDEAEKMARIEAALPGIPYTDMVIGLLPSVRNVIYANNGEIASVLDISGKNSFVSGNQPPLLELDAFNQPFLNFNGEIGCDLIADGINGGSLGGANRNTTTLFFICRNRMRQTGSAFFWGGWKQEVFYAYTKN